MSRENVLLALGALDAVNRRDLDAFLAFMDDEVEGVSRIVAMEGGLRGHAGMRTWWDNWFSAFPDYAIDVVETRERGDFVVAALRALGRGAGSDLPFEDVVWQVGRWRNGKIVWWQVFAVEAEALKAAGMRE